MVKIVSFDATHLTARDGYIARDISPSVRSGAFERFLDDLSQHPSASIDLGMPVVVTNRMMVDLLDQLDRPPVTNGVKQINPRGIENFLRLIDRHDGLGDKFQMANDEPSILKGSSRDDVMIGGQDRDTLNGGAKDDFLNGRSGNDRLIGENGRDELVGNNGNDTLRGGFGNDKLHGGAGSDILNGGQGADAFFFTAGGFAGNRETVDIIQDFQKGNGDQLVDLSGDLRLIAAGNIAIFHSKGSLLENTKTGDQVFVKNALLNQSDIHDHYVAPSPGTGNNNKTVKRGEPYDFDLVKLTEYNTGTEKVELYQLKFVNASDKTIANLAGLEINFRDAAALGGKIDQVTGATYAGGKFSLPDSQGAIDPKQTVPVVTFAVHDRPAQLTLDSDDFSAPGYTARAPGGNAIQGPLEGFHLSVKQFNGFNGGGVADVFIRNVGDTDLKIKDAVFRLTDKGVDDIDDTWGANEKRPFVFKVASFDGNPRSDLHPNEYQKLFGFVYEFDGHRPKLNDSDFHLLTPLDDMFT